MGYAHEDVALSVAIQRMMLAGRGAAGVIFTLDTESGFRHVVLTSSSWGARRERRPGQGSARRSLRAQADPARGQSVAEPMSQRCRTRLCDPAMRRPFVRGGDRPWWTASAPDDAGGPPTAAEKSLDRDRRERAGSAAPP
jgi:hypothetical protein